MTCACMRWVRHGRLDCVLKMDPGCIRAGARPLWWHPVANFTIPAVCLSVRELRCTKQATLALCAAVYYERRSNRRSRKSLVAAWPGMLSCYYPEQFQIVTIHTVLCSLT